MQKHANRILSVLLALVMILTMLPAAVFAEGETASIDTWSVSLGDSLGVNFYVTNPDAENSTVSATVGGNAAQVTTTQEDGSYVYTVDVAAAQMTDTISLVIANNGETVASKECTVYEYAKTILDGEYDDYVKQLVKEMLNYGAAAQTYFGHNTDNLANKDYEITSDAVPASGDAMSVDGAAEGISYYGATLVFKSKTAVRFYFNVTGSIDDYAFKVGETSYEPVASGSLYYVEVDGILPQDLDDVITLKVSETLSVSYSPLHYIVRMSAKGSDSLKALLQAMYTYHLEAKYYCSVVPVGALQSSGNGWVSTGIYATLPENDVYYVQEDWGIEYTPVNADVIKLVRDGVTTSVGVPGAGTLIKFTANDYYLKTENHTIVDGESLLPLQDQDYLIVEGRFEHPASGCVVYISKTYIYNNNGTMEFSTTEPVLPVSYDVGVLQASSNGAGSGGIYFSTAEVNDAPYGDWNIYYDTASVDCVKLIRDGQTISVGLTDKNTICKFGANDYYLRLENYTIGEYAPFTTDDMFIVEGAFTHKNSKTTLNIEKTYIYHDGTKWAFSATEPVLPTVYEVGVLSSNSAGVGKDANGNVHGIYALGTATEATYNSDWSVEYTPVSAENYKLIRDGVTYNIGVTGAGTLVMISQMDMYLKQESHTVADSENLLPLQDNDILVVEGKWICKQDALSVINITKTYILISDGTASFSATEPAIIVPYEVGTLSAHNNGVNVDSTAGIKGLYATGTATDATCNSDWSVEYAPVSTDNYKLIRDGVTYNIGVTDAGTLVMLSATDMYLKQEGHTVANSASLLPLRKGDILVVEGKWACKQDASSVLNITTTYILVTGEGSVKFLTAQPNIVKINSLKMSQNARGTSGFYVTANANSAPSGDWNVRYVAQSADAVKFVTGDTTTNVANTGGEMLVKFTDYDYYFESWTLGDTYANVAAGDMYIIDGLFYNAANDVYIDIDKTYVEFTADDELVYSVDAGSLNASSNGAGSGGIYFTLPENSAPYGDWDTYYDTASVDCLKLIRDGQTVSIGLTGRNTICKFSATDYYLRLENWTIGDYAPYTTDDVFIVEGVYTHANSGISMKIAKTYIYYDGSAWAFSTTEPSTSYEVGVLSAHNGGVSKNSDGNIQGIHATGAATDATYNSDWSVYYAPVSAANYKLIRNGVTYNVGVPGVDTMAMFGQTDFYLKQESHTIAGSDSLLPIQDGDILVVEGKWSCNQDEDSVINITKTYISINGSAAVFSDTDPRILNVGSMYAQSTNWYGDGIYFNVNANAAPSNADWSVLYKPASASNIKLIRNGVTTNIANTDAETIIKMGDSSCGLKLEQWMIPDYYPITEGDVLVVEGAFTNANNGYTMVIDKTYIIFGSVENDEVTFTTHYEETDYGTVILPTSVDTLNIGMWNGSYHVFTEDKLAELQAAGITKIMGINTAYIGNDTDGDGSISDAEVASWLDRVYSYGISVIIDLRDWDGTTVPGYASHPGLMGFLMFDEPNSADFDTLAELKTKFDAVMPAGKLFYVNLFPECAADSSLGELTWWDQLTGTDLDYDADYVTAFLNKLDIEVLSWDNYSLLSGSGIRTEYFHNFEVMASKNKTLWYTMLSAGHGTTSASYATPTAEELRWQMAVAMTYGVQNIDHYTYVSHEDDYSCMVEYEDADGDGVYWETTDLYNDILAVDNEYLAWDNIFMAYDWVGVGTYSANSNNSMLSQLENSLTLSDYGLSVSADENLLVGVFQNNGQNAYMVTNAGSSGSTTVGDGKNFTMANATVTLTLGEGSYKCVAVIDNGEISYVAVSENNTVSINVEAYEGVFVIPVLN